ncbi:spike base protein, RCAP_Rcc01079 family [Aestuariivirga sp.]|uniref:spike base protein, RCAP_Rcc01079 family n=1 Tax=Aestuariivirga sp. TaxID=2650926 RepID=UPI0039E2F779
MAYSGLSDVLARWGFSKPSPDKFGGVGRIVPTSDSTDLTAPYPKSVVTLAAGNISVIPARQADDTPIPFVGVAAGYTVPYTVRRVLATGTSVAVATIED